MNRGPGTAAVALRAGLLLLLGAGGTAGVRWLAVPPLVAAGHRDLAGLRFDDALAALAAAALLLSWLWLAATSTLVLVDVLVSTVRRVPLGTRSRGCPRAVRAALVAGCGVALGATVAVPAYADPGTGTGSADRRAPLPGPLTGLRLPDRTTGGPDRADATTRSGSVRVRPGDSLWTIAARLLPDATDAAVGAAWRAIARANADRIGPDPDLIYPGTLLRLPDSLREERP
ncbi:MAG: LysM peptidoglycan-binding domain-containing protein [Nocardioidaceae bacterium]